jgi:hypothetical protein
VRDGDGGFSLIEVVIALLVLDVGLLGVLAMTFQAQRTLLTAVASESASLAVEWVADSISNTGWGGPGALETDLGVIRWAREGSGFVTVAFEPVSGAARTVGLIPTQPNVP